MELLKAQKLCRELMDLHGLTLKNKWTFKWSNSKNTAGRCTYKVNRSFFNLGGSIYPEGGVITLSKFITPIHSDEKVRDTILHEIAHGLTKGHHHDYVWQRKAIEIGSDGKRCFAICDDLHKAKKETSKYTGTCPLCKHEWHQSRLPKRDQWCKCAGRRFKQEEKIQYIMNGAPAKAHAAIPVVTPRVPVAASRGFQQYASAAQNPTFATHTSFPNIMLNQAPDSYKSMLDKFEKEFMPHINDDRALFEKIVMKAKTTSNSWRTMNREVRKACNQYMGDTDRMTNKEFQETWFYEGVMVGRTTWGKSAPWIGK